MQIERQRLGVVIETERQHGVQNVVAVDCFALLLVASVAGLGRDERYELGDALLDAFARVFGDLKMDWFSLVEQEQHRTGCATHTLPFSGIARFMIFAMLAMGRKRSCSRSGVCLDDTPSWQESSEMSAMHHHIIKTPFTSAFA